MIYLKNRSNWTCDYWLITQSQQTLCIETNIFQQRVITNQSGQLQNSSELPNKTVSGAKSITTKSCDYNSNDDKTLCNEISEFHQRKFLLVCLIKAVNLSNVDLVKFLKKPAMNLPNLNYLFIK